MKCASDILQSQNVDLGKDMDINVIDTLRQFSNLDLAKTDLVLSGYTAVDNTTDSNQMQVVGLVGESTEEVQQPDCMIHMAQQDILQN